MWGGVGGGGAVPHTSIIINEHHQIGNESVVVEIIDELWEGGMPTPSHSQMGCKKGRGSFYIAQYPVRWTAQSALHFLPSPGRPVHSDTNSASPGSILARQQLRAKAKSLTWVVHVECMAAK